MAERNGREAWPPEVSEQMREVDRLRRRGRYASALALIRQLAEAYPRQVRILSEMGQTLGIWGGAPAQALVIHMKRAESLAALGRDMEAERDWTLAVDEDPGNPWLLQQRAGARARQGRLESAVKDLTEALATQEGEDVDPELLLERGRLRGRLGDWDGARADFEAGLAALREGDSPELLDALRAGMAESARR